MFKHQPFDYESSSDLLKSARELNLDIPFSDNISPLLENVLIGERKLPNRLAVLPVEGADAYPNGTPTEHTWRRYTRLARGGSGLIWFEATAVVPEGRSNPRQLMLNSENLMSFKELVTHTRNTAKDSFGPEHEILCVLQLTHSGRYSKSKSESYPQIACFNPYLDKKPDEVRFMPDEELDLLQEDYIEAARLANHAGFDAIDIKSCHGYLLNDLLAGYNRKHSRYGGSFENRTRFLTEVIQKIHASIPRILISARLNAYDGVPYPYGFGFTKDSPLDIDLTELQTLIRRLMLFGCSFFSVTAGNPFYKPHLGRPFDRTIPGMALPDEHPLEGITRLLRATAGLQKSFPGVRFIGSGYSWLRQYFPNVGAAVVEQDQASVIGLGRSSLAYPDAPKDLMEKGAVDPEKACICCSRCSELMDAGLRVGCAVHDEEIYGKEYQKIKN
jgi:2,4-dienoyl-CoA reductase (NADPH2)